MPAYKVLGLDALFSVPEPPMLIEGILPRAGIMGITGAPGAGKTWLTFEMGRAITTGDKFLGKYPARQGAVLFVGQDASIFDYARQARKLMRDDWEFYENLRRDEPTATNDLHDYFKTIMHPGMLLENFEHIQMLAETANAISSGRISGGFWQDWDPQTGEVVSHNNVDVESGVVLIIFDTFANLTTASEKDEVLIGMIFKHLRWLATNTQAAIVLLHHNSYATEHNDGTRWRGSGAGPGALDSHIQLTPGKGDRIEVTIKKFRGLKPEPFEYTMEIDETSASLLFAEPDPSATKVDIKAALLPMLETYFSEHPGARTRVAIAGAIRPLMTLGADSTFEKYLKDALATLAKAGTIKRMGKSGWERC